MNHDDSLASGGSNSNEDSRLRLQEPPKVPGDEAEQQPEADWRSPQVRRGTITWCSTAPRVSEIQGSSYNLDSNL